MNTDIGSWIFGYVAGVLTAVLFSIAYGHYVARAQARHQAEHLRSVRDMVLAGQGKVELHAMKTPPHNDPHSET